MDVEAGLEDKRASCLELLMGATCGCVCEWCMHVRMCVIGKVCE